MHCTDASFSLLLHVFAEPQNNLQSSYAYAAPEVIYFMMYSDPHDLEKVDYQAQDCWRLGCTLAWLLTGQHLFADSADVQQQDTEDPLEATYDRIHKWVCFLTKTSAM